MSLARFIEKWTHEDYPPEKVAGPDLAAVEARFVFMLPEDYRQAVQAHGLPRPGIGLLDGILAARHFPGLVKAGDCIAVVGTVET